MEPNMEPNVEPAQVVVDIQSTVLVPAFEAEIPLLHTPEGECIPIHALCELRVELSSDDPASPEVAERINQILQEVSPRLKMDVGAGGRR